MSPPTTSATNRGRPRGVSRTRSTIRPSEQCLGERLLRLRQVVVRQDARLPARQPDRGRPHRRRAASSERDRAPKLEALLTTAHTQAPTFTVLPGPVDWPNVLQGRREHRPARLPGAARALRLLTRTCCSPSSSSTSKARATSRPSRRRSGRCSRATGRGPSDAMSAWRRTTRAAPCTCIDPTTSRRPTRGPRPPAAQRSDHNWFAERAARACSSAAAAQQRLVFVVDEVGQYVARSVTPHARPPGPCRGVPEAARPAVAGRHLSGEARRRRRQSRRQAGRASPGAGPVPDPRRPACPATSMRSPAGACWTRPPPGRTRVRGPGRRAPQQARRQRPP